MARVFKERWLAAVFAFVSRRGVKSTTENCNRQVVVVIFFCMSASLGRYGSDIGREGGFDGVLILLPSTILGRPEETTLQLWPLLPRLRGVAKLRRTILGL
jgi:hypothetical protein